MVFDYASLNVKQEEADKHLPVTFEYVAEEKNGKFENVPYIRIWLSKNSEVHRKVTEDDKVRFQDRWEAFLKGEEAPQEGTPIKAVPFATPANIAACKAERIYTVEQLVQVPDQRLQRAYLTNFKYQCGDWLKQKGDSQHLKDMRSEIEALKRENELLKERFRDAGLPKPQAKKKRRRRKVTNDNLDDDSQSGQ